VPSTEQADINRMALLFNQVVNTAVDTSSHSLGFVPVGAQGADAVALQTALVTDEQSTLFLNVT